MSARWERSVKGHADGSQPSDRGSNPRLRSAASLISPFSPDFRAVDMSDLLFVAYEIP